MCSHLGNLENIFGLISHISSSHFIGTTYIWCDTCSSICIILGMTYFVSRVLVKEYDGLYLKSQEAEKEVNILQMKIEEANNNQSKLHKDMDCKYCFIQTKYIVICEQLVVMDNVSFVLLVCYSRYPNTIEYISRH